MKELNKVLTICKVLKMQLKLSGIHRINWIDRINTLKGDY